jgi:hypothetical protein
MSRINTNKKLFGAPVPSSFSLLVDITQLPIIRNCLLTFHFLEKEVFEVIFQMKHNKARGPNRFPQNSIRPFGRSLRKFYGFVCPITGR